MSLLVSGFVCFLFVCLLVLKGDRSLWSIYPLNLIPEKQLISINRKKEVELSITDSL